MRLPPHITPHSQNDAVQRDRDEDRDEQPRVRPRRHGEQGRVLAEGVERVEHLDYDDDGQGERARLGLAGLRGKGGLSSAGQGSEAGNPRGGVKGK